jgi:hypothetical protein
MSQFKPRNQKELPYMQFLKLFRLTLPLVCLSSTLLTSQAAGSIYLSNTDATDFGGYGIAGATMLAQPFRTGTSPGGYILNSADLLMHYWQPGVSDFHVSIYSNASGKPGAPLEMLSGDTNPYLDGTYSYTSSGITLSPITFYWIVASASNTSSNTPFSGYDWGETRDTVFSGNDGWQIPFGLTHAIYNIVPGQWTVYASSTYGTQQFAIEATPVPEPGLSALMTLGSGGFVWRRIVRSRSTYGKGRSGSSRTI